MKATLLTLLCISFLSACQKTKEPTAEPATVPQSDSAASTPLPEAKSFITSKKSLRKKKFAHVNEAERLKQTLIVTWISEDTIEYTLKEESDLCVMDYQAKAVNRYPGGDGESEEDENGDAYLATEYIHENVEYILAIRISDDEDQAQIRFTAKQDEGDIDCVLYDNLVMKVE
jgi:hypothetical protein